MVKVENIDVWGFEHAIRGMRNPLNSWAKSDSIKDTPSSYSVGKNDLALMKRLYKAGTEHRKYLRQIFVSMDITAPLYWWKEFDKYQIGVVTNSCSTMHTIHKKEFSLDDFSIEHVSDDALDIDCSNGKYSNKPIDALIDLIDILNACREKYLETKDKKWWWQIIQLLPASYNQKRTVTMNYENVMTIINQRTGHKLDEWKTLIDEFENNLPYVKTIRAE